RIGRMKEVLSDLKTVVIDHHPPGDQPIGGISLRDPQACATSELVYDVILAAGGPWNVHIAQGVYVGLLTDTGGFRFENASAACHLLAADTIALGVQPHVVHERVYGWAPLRKYRLLERALATLQHDPDAGVSWMTIPREAYEEVGATAEDLEGIVDIPRSIAG